MMEQVIGLFDEVWENDVMPLVSARAVRRLEARVPGLQVTSAGGMMPFASEGRLAGLPYYFRFQHGQAQLRVGGNLNRAPLYQATEPYGRSLDGTLDQEEFTCLLLALVPRLRPAPRSWEFSGVVVHDTPRGPAVGSATTYGAWGHSPEEAWREMHRYPEGDAVYAEMVSREEHAANMAARRMNPHTITVDERVWPPTKPVFAVAPRWSPLRWLRRP
jgi:hypothetical protein